jgi:hypothetical protein
MLYKYYTLTSYNLDALKVGYFYFSKAKCLNDPFDMTFGLLSQNIINKLYPNERTIVSASKKMKNYGVCCFSEKWNNNILWAYYANNYSGFVVGYDETLFHKIMDENLVRVPLQKVDYIENVECIYEQETFSYYPLSNEKGIEANAVECLMPSFDSIIDPKEYDKFFTYLCAIKSKSWQSEREWRLIAANDVINRDHRAIIKEEGGYKIPMPQGCVKELFVGFNFDKKYNGDIKEIMLRHKLTNAYRVQASQKPYDLEKVKYDIEKTD